MNLLFETEMMHFASEIIIQDQYLILVPSIFVFQKLRHQLHCCVHPPEGSSWREVLRCQKTVEYVLTLFDDLEEGYNSIKTSMCVLCQHY